MCPSWRLSVVLFLLSCSLLTIHSRDCKFKCPSTAICRAGSCQCKTGTRAGIGNFYCYNPFTNGGFNYGGCFLFGDPHIVNFNGERGSFPLPCRHRVTQFANPSTSCEVEVFATGDIVPRGYIFERNVEIRITIGFDDIDVYFEGDASPYYTINSGSEQELSPDGSLTTLTYGSRDIFIQYDTVDQIWEVWSSPTDCDFTIAFRPYVGDGNLHDQERIPGLAVIARMNPAYFSEPFSTLPSSMCSSPAFPLALQEASLTPGLENGRLALVNGFLGLPQSIPQQPFETFDRACERTQESFLEDCTAETRLVALNTCGPFLVSGMPYCLTQNEINQMDIFDDCLESVCIEDETICNHIRDVMGEANCQVPPQFDAYCNSLGG